MAMRAKEEMTEPFEPYQPQVDDSYDWDPEDQYRADDPPQVIWGRVAIFAAMLFVAFFIGRALAPSGGVPQEEMDAVRADLQQARDEIETLQTQLAAVQQEADDLRSDAEEQQQDQGAGGGDAEEEDTSETETVEVEMYTIEAGDTLRGIAQKFYDDPELADFLASHNGISDPTVLTVGNEIEIPPQPE